MMKWEKAPLSISVRKTSSLIEGIRSKPNVKRVYPPEADRLASIHHKHNRFPLLKHSLFPFWAALDLYSGLIVWKIKRKKRDAGKVQRCLFQLNATWCLRTVKVIFSWMMTHCGPMKQGFSLWSLQARVRRSVSAKNRENTIGCGAPCCYPQNIGELWAAKWDGFSCSRFCC